MPILSIQNLKARIDETEILHGVTCSIQPGEVVALMGPNGSGKSTLAHILMGHPAYEVTAGSVQWDNQDLLSLKPEERAKAGLFLSFQNPQEIAGVTIGNFLRLAYNATHAEPYGVHEFIAILKEKSALLGLPPEFILRSVNDGFSGGEKKRAELLQLAVLQPKLAILDELDSGLDIDGLKMVGQALSTIRAQQPEMSLLLITHYQRLLDVIPVDRILVMRQGKIVHEGDTTVVSVIEQKGYQAF